MYRSYKDYAKHENDKLTNLRTLARWIYKEFYWTPASEDLERLNELVDEVTDELREGRDLANLLDGSMEGASIEDMKEAVEHVFNDLDVGDLAELVALVRTWRGILQGFATCLGGEYDVNHWKGRKSLSEDVTAILEGFEKPNESVAHDRAILMDKFANMFDDLCSGGPEMIVEIFKAEGIDTDVEEVRQYLGE